MSPLIIAADANIPLIAEACRGLGEVRIFHSSDLDETARIIRSADVLLCRSTIRVDEALLRDTPVRFVATATSGFDHVDTAWLAANGVSFFAANGCNARSVAEYVWTALLLLAERKALDLAGMRIGIVGVGQVGSRVAAIAEALGVRVVLNDPPLRERTGETRFRSLDEALACDIVTLHVPLLRDGRHPTWHLIDARALRHMSGDAVFINTSRGAVVDQVALLQTQPRSMILDVFENEPHIDPDLPFLADIATPHIAGHSYDGKLEGTKMVYAALCTFLGVASEWDYRDSVPVNHVLDQTYPDLQGYARVNAILRQVYDIQADDLALREAMRGDASLRGPRFSALREDYPQRREYHTFRVDGETSPDDVARMLIALGVRTPTRDREVGGILPPCP
jgi:erythronate-4-phosphate dehydrogenase